MKITDEEFNKLTESTQKIINEELEHIKIVEAHQIKIVEEHQKRVKRQRDLSRILCKTTYSRCKEYYCLKKVTMEEIKEEDK